MARPVEEWTKIAEASPRIVDEPLWRRVQEILAERERSPQQPAIRIYPLRGRLKCGTCGAAMVGQTMKSKGREYRYYVCRRYFDRRTGRTCPARYVRADALEAGLWREVRAKLADPVVVLEELRRERRPETDPAEAERLEKRSASLVNRERRLVKLYSFGEVDEHMLREEIAAICREKAVLEERLRALRPSHDRELGAIDEPLLARACREVQRWLDRAGEAERQLALEALQIAIVATREQATVNGVIPAEPPEFLILQRASA